MNPNRNLNRWARDHGYSDFDAYIRAGNSILDAQQDITQRINSLNLALAQIQRYTTPDADNAQIQGDEP